MEWSRDVPQGKGPDAQSLIPEGKRKRKKGKETERDRDRETKKEKVP